MMDGGGLAWVLLDYGLFALGIVAIGWLLINKKELFVRVESTIYQPFRALLAIAEGLPTIPKQILQGITYFAVLLLVIIWTIVCQWLNHHSFGGLAMLGLSFEAVLLVRLFAQDARPPQEKSSDKDAL